MYEYDEVSDMSIKIIRKLNDNGIKCSVLTKGILPIELAELSNKNEYGITLVSLSEEFRNEFEPKTANFHDRIQALQELHDTGCYTWVSIEPYPTPNIIEQDLNEILDAVSAMRSLISERSNWPPASCNTFNMGLIKYAILPSEDKVFKFIINPSILIC